MDLLMVLIRLGGGGRKNIFFKKLTLLACAMLLSSHLPLAGKLFKKNFGSLSALGTQRLLANFFKPISIHCLANPIHYVAQAKKVSFKISFPHSHFVGGILGSHTDPGPDPAIVDRSDGGNRTLLNLVPICQSVKLQFCCRKDFENEDWVQFYF